MSDPIHHECGIALIRLLKPMSYYAEKYGSMLYGLNKLYILMEKQHNRGQDGAGIGVVTLDVPPGKPYIYRQRAVQPSPIANIFNGIYKEYTDFQKKYPLNDYNHIKHELPFVGELLMGHLRYGTHGGNDIRYCHPFHRKSNYMTKNLLIAGNFNMTNNDELFHLLVELGQYPVNQTDTLTVLEKIGHFLDSENEYLYHKYQEKGLSNEEITPRIIEDLSLQYILEKSARDFDGGYAITGMIGHGDSFVLRDPNGIRPAYYYHDDEVVVVASERPAIRTTFNLPYQEIEEIKPGHALIIRKSGEIMEPQIIEPRERKSCSFERIYFSRGTDTDIYRERKNLGKLLTTHVLEEVDYDIKHTVFSYIPNTAEVAFLGLIEGLQEYLEKQRKEQLLQTAKPDSQAIDELFKTRIRVEKIAVKDTKIRTFIAEDKGRKDLVNHVYDTSYGIIQNDVDTLVILDDSIVRGTTLKDSIIGILDRLHPKKIVIVSSAPQIRYPDCYGIDMSKLRDFVAFRAAIELLKDQGKEHLIRQVYHRCKEEVKKPAADNQNIVREIFSSFTATEVSQKIAELVRPDNLRAELTIIYQTIENLHKAIPTHTGDWYFTGNYPTPGGNKVANQSFINFFDGSDKRAY